MQIHKGDVHTSLAYIRLYFAQYLLETSQFKGSVNTLRMNTAAEKVTVHDIDVLF